MKLFIAILTVFTITCISAQESIDPSEEADRAKKLYAEMYAEESKIFTCPPGYWRNCTCSCECLNRNLPENQCVAPSVFNNRICACQCPKDIRPECFDYRKYFSVKDCKCHCLETKECKRCSEPYVWSEATCNCECPKKTTCPAGRYWNDKSCQCECVQKRECCDFKYFDEKACDCVCREQPKDPNGPIYMSQRPEYFWSPQLCKYLNRLEIEKDPYFYDRILGYL